MKIQFDSAISLLHETSVGALATQSMQIPGYPFASILPFFLDEQHQPVFHISRLAEHTKNLITDPRASFVVTNPDGQNILTSARLTVVGDVEQVDASPELIARYLRYHPDGVQYIDFGDFSFFRLVPKRLRFVAGFGQMGWIEGDQWSRAVALPLIDEDKCLQELIEFQGPGIRLLGLDAYGFDIERDGKRERQPFPSVPVPTEKIIDATKHILAAI